MGALRRILGVVLKPRRRAGKADDTSASPMDFEFEVEDEPLESGVAGDEKAVVGTDAASADESDLREWPRPSAWSPRSWSRRRVRLAGGVATVVAAALAVDAFVVQADRRARDRISVSAVDAAYVPSGDGEGLDLIVSLRDDGPAMATLYWVGVDQPGLALGYPPIPLPMRVGHAVGVRLAGRYLCTGTTGNVARTLTAVVESPRGVISSLTVAMPTGAELPAGWQSAREGFCEWMAMAHVPKLP